MRNNILTNKPSPITLKVKTIFKVKHFCLTLKIYIGHKLYQPNGQAQKSKSRKISKN